MPRLPRTGLALHCIAALLAFACLLSLRYAFVLSPTAHVHIGLISAGLWVQDDSIVVPSFSPFPTAPVRPAPSSQRRIFYTYRHAFGFPLWYETGTAAGRSWTFPLWPLFAAAAAIWTWRFASRRLARKPWQCQQCGSALRGLTSPVCPECGRPAHPTELRP